MKKIARALPLALIFALFFGLFEKIPDAGAAQPTPYNRQANFTDWTQNHPDLPQNGLDMDNEYNAIKTTLDAVLFNLTLIQRDDGFLANNSVGADQLQASLNFGLNAAAPWVTAHNYVLNDAVYFGNAIYRCAVPHTSGIFATDLAASKWSILLNFDPYVTASAGSASSAASSASAASASAASAAMNVGNLSGTSSSSVAVGTGSKSFATQPGKFFTVPTRLLISSGASPTNYMFGAVTAYSAGALTVNVTATGGSGTFSDWNILVAGEQGATGAQGAPGAGTGDMLKANNLSELPSKPTARINLGVQIGADVQAHDTELDALAAVTSATDRLPYFTSAGIAGITTFTSQGRLLVAGVDAAANRATLGLGTASVLTAGTSANNVVQLDGSAKLPAIDGSQLTNLPASGAMSLVSTKVLAGDSTVDFTGLSSSCESYRVIFSGIDQTNSSQLTVLTSSNNGSSYDVGSTNYRWWNTVINGTGTTTVTNSTGDTSISISAGSRVLLITGEFNFYALSRTDTSKFVNWTLQTDSGTSESYYMHGGGARISTTAVNGIRFKRTLGTFDVGTVKLYCIN